MWRYEELLPVGDVRVSLGETETPLLSLPRLSERWGVEVLLKDDGGLPGDTFKARGAAIGLSRAVELGAKHVVMPTAGNAGGTWSLYAARAGIDITVTMAQTAPVANQTEVEMAGGRLELVAGSIFDAGRRARDIAAAEGAYFAATFDEPYRLEGKKTCWLELFDQLGGRWPGTVVMPVGGGVAALALAKAVVETRALGWTDGDGPRIVGVQPEDCAPIVAAFDAGADDVEPWPHETTTIASGLRVPAPSEGRLVLRAVRESGGTMLAVSETAIVAAVAELARTEGVFACPEGAATMAAAERLADTQGLEAPVVLYNTGAGAKYLHALVSTA